MKKYKLTQNIKKIGNITLHQIKALKDFGIVKAGTLGGYIEKEDNLSQEGKAWVSGNALVYGNARVYGDAEVCCDARVYDDAEVSCHSWVSGDAEVSGNAWVYGSACVSGYARVSGNAWVSGYARVSGDAEVYGNAWVSNINQLFTMGPIDRLYRTTTFYRNKDNEISVVCGCFNGSINEFEIAVKNTHGDNEHAKAYELAVELAKLQIDLS